MSADPSTRTFGWGLTRGMQALLVLQMCLQGLLAVDGWQDDGGPGVPVVLQLVFAVACPVAAVFAEAGIVRVGAGRIRWRDRRLRRIDLAAAEVEDIRADEASHKVVLLTRDGRRLALPMRPSVGWEVRRALLGDGPSLLHFLEGRA